MGKGYRRPIEFYNREEVFPPGISWQPKRDYRREEGIVAYKFRYGYNEAGNPKNSTREIRISDYTDNFINERELAWLVFDRAHLGQATFFDGAPLIWNEETHFYEFEKVGKVDTTLEILACTELDELRINYKREVIFEWSKIGHANYPYDFELTDYKVLIEMDGIQHKEATDYFGGEEGFSHQNEIDKLKERLAIENGYLFLRISDEDSFSFKETLTKFLKEHNIDIIGDRQIV